MDSSTWTSIGLVLVFVLIGGVFAATEMALVTLRSSQIDQLEQQGRRGRVVARLARDSGTFLSAVQIGVTFAGFLSSAYGAQTIAPALVPLLEGFGLSSSVASTVALIVLTLAVSYLSLVLGELVPKRMALQSPTRIATVTGPPLSTFASLMRPVIWLLEVSTRTVLRLLGFDPNVTEEAMTDDEVRHIVTTHQGFDDDERMMMRDVFAAAERSVQEVMRHRSDMVALAADATVLDAVEVVRDQPYSRYPVYDEDIDDITGFVHVRDLLDVRGDESRLHEPVGSLAREILFLPGTGPLMPAMNQMRRTGNHIAIVLDEYGGTDGVVTLEDMLEELVGEIWDEYDTDTERIELSLNESMSFDAQTNLEDFAERSGVELAEGPYATVAGWVVARLGRLAEEGDRIMVPPAETVDTEDDDDEEGREQAAVRYEIEVSQMQRHRIVRVTLRKVAREAAESRDATHETAAEAARAHHEPSREGSE